MQMGLTFLVECKYIELLVTGCNITNTWTLLDGDVSAGGNTLVVDRNITGWHVSVHSPHYINWQVLLKSH